jgi:hypothetical protein
MSEQPFADLLRALATLTHRRVMLSLAAGAAGLGFPGSSADVAAKKRKKRKRKTKRKCPAGHAICGKVCCTPDRQCADGTCQCKTPCGDVCCPEGQGCTDANENQCGCTVATCPGPCVCDGAVGLRVCFTADLLLCDGLKLCGSLFDCPPGTACQVACDAAVCVPLCELA